MEIVYCEKCGVRIPDGDFDRGVAIMTEDGAYCAKCSPEMAPVQVAAPKRRTPGSSRRSSAKPDTGKFRRPKASDTGRFRRPAALAETGRRDREMGRGRRDSGPQRPSGPSAGLIAIIALACGFAVAAGAMIFFRGGGGEAPGPRRRRQARTREVVKEPIKEPEGPKDTPKEEPRKIFGLQALEPVQPKEAPQAPKKVFKRAPHLGNAFVYFLEREETHLSAFELECKRGEEWLRDPKGRPPKLVVYAPAAAKPPTIDGNLDDECWELAGRARDFVVGEKNKETENAPAPEKTEAFICHDKHNLYVALKAWDNDIAGLVRKGTETKKSLWDDDGVELFLDFDRDYRDYRQIIINVDGVSSEGAGHAGALPETEGLEVKVKEYPDHWIMEVLIPIEAAGGGGTKAGITWGINLVKNCWVDGKYVSTSWAHLKSGTNHAPLEFGYLIFK